MKFDVELKTYGTLLLVRLYWHLPHKLGEPTPISEGGVRWEGMKDWERTERAVLDDLIGRGQITKAQFTWIKELDNNAIIFCRRKKIEKPHLPMSVEKLRLTLLNA